MRTREQIKEQFEKDTANHSMEILKDDGLYRHLKFTKDGSSVYRFDIITWPGYLAVAGDMGEWVFSRIPDMFEFFIMDERDWNYKHIINPGYWSEKLQAADCRTGGRSDSNGYEEFQQEVFEENVWNLYNQFAEEYADEDDEAVTEAYPEDTQTYAQMLEELKEAIQEEVIDCSYDGEMRAYDAAMSFNWESHNGELKFDMNEFYEFNCRDYTYHYIWICYAIVWGIQQYNEHEKEKPVPPAGLILKEGEQPA